MCFVSKDFEGLLRQNIRYVYTREFSPELFFVFLEQLLNCFALEFLNEL